jgi:KaiC/GvpD/RAD55 family RecA-like ATPase
MDLDQELIGSVLRGGKEALVHLMDNGLSAEEHLFGDGKKAYEYLVKHWKEYGELASLEAVNNCIDTEENLEFRLKDSHKYYLDEVFKRRLYTLQKRGMESVGGLLSEKDFTGAAEAWSEIHHKIQNEHLTVRKVESLLALGKDVISDYNDAKAGIRGIPTPWETMNEQTLGWWPEDLILFVGRLGVGKTWILVISAHAAWAAGKKVLVVSTEMSKKQMARRFFALHLRMPYDEIRRGRLGEFVEEKFYKGIQDVMNDQGINIVSGGFDYTIDNLFAVIEEDKPELLCVDGPYLIKNSGKDRHERVSNTFDDLKRMGGKGKHATLTNLQFNRSAKTGQSSTISADNIGITDVAGWNSSVAYGLMQTEEQLANWRLGIKALKIREGKPGQFMINWNHQAMDFGEIPSEDENKPSTQAGAPGGGDHAVAKDDDYEDLPF